jgi:hypothetical protein
MKRRVNAIIILIALYGVIYILNSQLFDIHKSFYMYTVSWTTRNVLPFVLILTLIMTLLGRWYITSFVSFSGYILGIILGELFGGFKSNVPPRYLHYGWLIWGCVYILSIVIGVIMERTMKSSEKRAIKG